MFRFHQNRQSGDESSHLKPNPQTRNTWAIHVLASKPSTESAHLLLKSNRAEWPSSPESYKSKLLSP